MIRIRTVDPLEFAPAASDVLRAAWNPPTLDYSPEFLRWIFSAPSSLPPIATLVFEDEEPVGFVGAFGRRIRYRGETHEVYHSSFYSVRPGPGRGMVAPVLMRKEAEVIRSSKRPFLVFAQEGTIGAQLLNGLNSLGFTMWPIGTYTIYGSVPRPSDGAEVRIVDPTEWLEAYAALRSEFPDVIHADLAATDLEFELRDPWGRQCAIAVDKETEQTLGAAVLSHTRSTTQTGIQTVPTLHHVRCINAEALKSLAKAAADAGSGAASYPTIVTLPNRTGLSDDVLRRAGVRAMPVRFIGYVVAQDPANVLLTATATDVEVL